MCSGWCRLVLISIVFVHRLILDMLIRCKIQVLNAIKRCQLLLGYFICFSCKLFNLNVSHIQDVSKFRFYHMYVPDHTKSSPVVPRSRPLRSDATSPCLALVNQLVIKGFIQSLEIQIYTQTADKPYIFCLGTDFSFWLCAFSHRSI